MGVLPEAPYRNVAGREYHLVEQRRGEKNQEQKSQEGVFHPGSGYPVKIDAFMSSSFSKREKAAQVAGQWHVQAGPRQFLIQQALMCLCLMLPFPRPELSGETAA